MTWRNRLKGLMKRGNDMEPDKILSACDHTLLKQDATPDQIMELCEDAVRYGTFSVCVPPCYVSMARAYMNQAGSDVRVCTVIGFPNGNETTETKRFETLDALENGADEIDMVINIGMLKAREYDYVLDEVRSIKAICGDHILKVIIETCLLTYEEKIEMCEIVTKSGADFIKTSTGFSTGGATFDDVKLMSDNIGPGVKIKAAGGISSLEDAERFLELGASRLGTSRIVKLIKEKERQ